MLMQTNSYIVPKDKRTEHSRLIARFRQTLARLGCEHFEAYEQVGANWSPTEATGRFVQIMRFRDRKHQQQVQAAERSDPAAQALIKEFCELINFPYQQQQGLFAVGFYTSILPGGTPQRVPPPGPHRIEATHAPLPLPPQLPEPSVPETSAPPPVETQAQLSLDEVEPGRDSEPESEPTPAAREPDDAASDSAIRF